MIKKFLLPVLLLFSFANFAQQGTASPYSFYGIGEIKFKGTAENRLMGGVSVFSDSIHINLQNPASYAGLKLTTFSVGGSFNTTKFTSYNDNEKAQRTTVDYMAAAFPIGRKLGVSFGLIPYSSVGYRINTKDANAITRNYEGSGGVNKGYVGVGYKINTKLSVGLDIQYNFGEIETTSIFDNPNLQWGSQERNNTDISGVNFNIGTMYKTRFKNKYDFYGSLTFTPESNLSLNNTRVFSTINYIEGVPPSIVESLAAENSKRTIKMPSKFVLGTGFGKARKWLIGAEVALQQSSGFGNRISDISNTQYENAIRYSVGGYYIPNYTSFSSYFSKVVYRAGLRYENTGLVLNNETIRDYAFTGGFGFPLGGTFSNLNVGAEFGRRGTAKARLVEENYLNLIFSLSLNDQWFIKRRYD